MAAYVIAEVNVTNPTLYDECASGTTPQNTRWRSRCGTRRRAPD